MSRIPSNDEAGALVSEVTPLPTTALQWYQRRVKSRSGLATTRGAQRPYHLMMFGQRR